MEMHLYPNEIKRIMIERILRLFLNKEKTDGRNIKINGEKDKVLLSDVQ